MRAILTYHSIDTSGSVISVSPEVFDEHVRWMASGSVDVLPLADLLRSSDDRDAIAITFDDAYTNFADEAWPRLKDHNLPATLFVPTAFVGKSNGWGELRGGRMPQLSIMGWDALGRLQDEGVSLGAHTRTHPDLQGLDRAAIEAEVRGSCEDVWRETGTRPSAFAYPYGHWTPTAAAVVRDACALACTTELRPLRQGEDPCLLPRLDTFYLNGPARLQNFGGLVFREYLRLRLHARTVAQRIRARQTR